MIWEWSTSVKDPNTWHYVAENGDVYIIDKVNVAPNERYVPVIEHKNDRKISHINITNNPTTLHGAMRDCVIHYYTNVVKHRSINID